jgi:hypothetical protein
MGVLQEIEVGPQSINLADAAPPRCEAVHSAGLALSRAETAV